MEKADSPLRVVVCDAGPLIHLDELGLLWLLGDFAELLVPTAVKAEVERHRPAVFGAGEPQFQVVAPARLPTPELLASSRLFPLHSGETQAIPIAIERSADLLLTDDTAARLAAGQLRLGVHGTIGVLARSIRRGQCTPPEVVAHLRAIPSRSTLHIKPTLLAEIVSQIEGLV